MIQLGEWLTAFDGRFLNIIDDAYRDLRTGEQIAPVVLDEPAWSQLIEGSIGSDGWCAIATESADGPPPLDTHIETTEQTEAMLDQTDPSAVFVCLDTGHFAYRGGDPLGSTASTTSGNPYLHIKNVDPRVLDTVTAQGLPLVEAVKMEVFCEPHAGLLDFVDMRGALDDAGFDGYLMVEQDMFEPPHDKPLPIARRTREYLEGIGLGDS